MNTVPVLCAFLLVFALVAAADEWQIVDGATKMCLDNGTGKQGQSLQMWNCVADEGRAKKVGQRWSIDRAEAPYTHLYRIKDLATGKCLDNGPNAKGDRKPPQMWGCVGISGAAKNGQLWDIKCADKLGYYRIVDASTGECLDNGTAKNTKPPQMWGCVGNENDALRVGQLWELKRTAF